MLHCAAPTNNDDGCRVWTVLLLLAAEPSACGASKTSALEFETFICAAAAPPLLPFLSPSASLERFRHFEHIMASDALEVVSKMVPSQEDLTDEQMEEMLAQATARLREKEESKMFQTEAPHKFTFPKMDAGALEKPYVVTKGNIAEADKARLIDQKHRQNDSLIRKVEDPVNAKKIAAEVRSQHDFSTPPCL